jgi:hypothetical protein
MDLANNFTNDGAPVDQNFKHAGIRLRTYQAEMLEASLKGNIIVVQDTGSGKTHMFVSSFCFGSCGFSAAYPFTVLWLEQLPSWKPALPTRCVQPGQHMLNVHLTKASSFGSLRQM